MTELTRSLLAWGLAICMVVLCGAILILAVLYYSGIVHAQEPAVAQTDEQLPKQLLECSALAARLPDYYYLNGKTETARLFEAAKANFSVVWRAWDEIISEVTPEDFPLHLRSLSEDFWFGMAVAEALENVDDFLVERVPWDAGTYFETIKPARERAAEREFNSRNCRYLR